MKKKILSIILIAVLLLPCVFVLSACDSEDDLQNTEVHYTVAFKTNGGSEIADKTCDVIEVSPTTIREGYNFKGWYFDSKCTSIVNFPLSVDKDMTLYAKWEKTREKIISDCMAYIDSQEDNKLFSQDDNSEENIVDVVNTTITHIGKMFILDWERAYAQLSANDFLYISEYDLYLSFDYGELESATGYFTYSYEFYYGDTLYSGMTATYRITSLDKNGNTYLMDGYFSNFTIICNYDETEEEVEDSLQTNLTLSLYDFKFLIPVEYWNTLFDFSE